MIGEMVKPVLTASEACHRLVPKGRAEREVINVRKQKVYTGRGMKSKEEAYERVLSAGRKLRRALIIAGVLFLSGGLLTFINLWHTMEKYGGSGSISVHEYVVMAIVGIAAICIGFYFCLKAASLSPKKRKSSLR